jgi:sulfur relay (sulfurtransferase) DsrC/TusE family protein
MPVIKREINLGVTEEEWKEFIKELTEISNCIRTRGIEKALDKYASEEGDLKYLLKLFESEPQEHLAQASEIPDQPSHRSRDRPRQQ